MFLVGTGYHHFNWCDLMNEDGEYDFTKIRDWMATYTKFGRPFGFGVMAVNTSSEKEYITPKYVFDEGAEHFTHRNGESTQIIPDWKDPVFLKEGKRLATELGKEFNGDKIVSFVEILSYGNWGEQLLFNIETGDPDYMKKQSILPEFFRDNYVQPYLDAFPDTFLYNSWGTEEFDEVYLELADRGVALRRDGIIKYTNGLDTLAASAQKLPTGFEFSKSYKRFIEEGMTNEEFNRRLEEAIAIAKPSYINFDDDWYDQNQAYVEELANRMGYYFRLKEATYHSDLKANGEMTLSFRNDGVAPVYGPCSVFVGLLDGDGTIVRKFATACDPASWLPDTTKTERFTVDFSAVPAGNYRLAVGLFQNESDPSPTYLLGSEGKTENGWYALGDVVL